MNNHKKVCLKINGEQAVKQEKRTIEFKTYFKQIQYLCKIYSDFECILDSVESYEGSCSKKYQDYIPCHCNCHSKSLEFVIQNNLKHDTIAV